MGVSSGREGRNSAQSTDHTEVRAMQFEVVKENFSVFDPHKQNKIFLDQALRICYQQQAQGKDDPEVTRRLRALEIPNSQHIDLDDFVNFWIQWQSQMPMRQRSRKGRLTGMSAASRSGQEPSLISYPSTENSKCFVNTGFASWSEQRAKWKSRATNQPRREKAAYMDHDSVRDVVNGYGRFQRYVGVKNVIDALVDVWEEDGLFDSIK